VTNQAPTVQEGPIDHEGVTRMAAVGLDALAALIEGLLGAQPPGEDPSGFPAV
jgi:hypothetical protein